MKKTLLLCNAALYAIMYNIGLFFVGFVFGNTYEFGQIMNDGDWIALPLLWQYFFFPAVFLVCFFIGSHFVKCRENLSVKSFVILGAVTWIPLFAYWILLYRQNYSHLMPEMYWFSFGNSILATVIFVIYIICAILTHKENKALKYKTYPVQE
jgi:hypothetical protein